MKNNIKTLRESRMMSKSEFARKAGVSVLTIDRIEKGSPLRMETKRKILKALDLSIEDMDKVFITEEILS